MKVDIVIKEMDVPNDKYCSSGHVAPDTYKRNGPDSKDEPIRFFQICGNNIFGNYCEPCLVIANYLASKVE